MTANLTEAQRKTLAKQLDDRRRQLRAELQTKLNTQDNPALLGLQNRMQETDDWAVADSLAELDIAGLRHALRELRDVDAALARMRGGTYGRCVDCDEPIAPARLAAYPTAPRCIECQEVHEARPGGRGT